MTNTNDTGAGSLRQAILDANANPGARHDRVQHPGRRRPHDHAGDGAADRSPSPSSIDGYTQPGASPNTDPVGDQRRPPDRARRQRRRKRTGLHFTFASGEHRSGAGHQPIGDPAIGIDPGQLRSIRGQLHRHRSDRLGPGERTRHRHGPEHAVVVGGTTPADRNLVSGNAGASDGASARRAGTVVQGNLIGTDATERSRSPTASASWTASATSIGGADAGAGNVISGNERLSVLTQPAPPSSRATSSARRPTEPARSATGQGFAAAAATTRSAEPRPVRATSSPSTAAAASWPNAGDEQRDPRQLDPRQRRSRHRPRRRRPERQRPADADDGPNDLQNFPIVREVEHLGPQGAGTHADRGKLHSTPSTTFDLDFYANPACSNFPREFLEGETYLGTSQVTTDGNGDAAIRRHAARPDRGRRAHLGDGDRSGRQHLRVLAADHLLDLARPPGPDAGGTGSRLRHRLRRPDDADGRRRRRARASPSSTTTARRRRRRPSRPGTVNDVVVDDARRHDRHAHQGLGRRLPRRAGRPAVLLLRHDPRLQRHHRRRRRRQLRRRPADAAPADGRLPPEGEARPLLRPAALHRRSSPTSPAPRPSPPGSTSSSPRASPAAAAADNYCPANPVRRDQMAVLLLKAEHGSSYTPPACTASFADVPCAEPVRPLDRRPRRRAASPAAAAAATTAPTNPATRGQMAVFITKTFNLQ